MSADGFTLRLYGKSIVFFLVFAILSCSRASFSQEREIIPYDFVLEKQVNALPGDIVSIPLIKTAGSEEAHGFDFLIGYDTSIVTVHSVDYGELFDIPGEFEWEYVTAYSISPEDCTELNCPTGFVGVASLADTDNGPYHPVKDPETGRIKVIPDNTVLFTLNFQVADNLDPSELYIPIVFFWTLCSDNQVAFTYEYDGPFDIRSALTRYVFDSDGIQITDYDAELPSYFGTPAFCITTAMSERLCDFHNGGFGWGCADANSDGSINLLDILFIINLVYKNGSMPAIPEFCDVNNDSSINILDVVLLIDYIYKDGTKPNCPQPQ